MEVFPTEARATCHGISAAMGKLGAAVGVLILKPLSDHYCPNHDCSTIKDEKVGVVVSGLGNVRKVSYGSRSMATTHLELTTVIRPLPPLPKVSTRPPNPTPTLL